MKIKVLAVNGAHVLNLELLDHKMIQYIGYTQDVKAVAKVKSEEVITLDVSDMRYRMYYMRHLLAHDLLPADAATAKWASLPFKEIK